jgi:hypothetical protein
MSQFMRWLSDRVVKEGIDAGDNPIDAFKFNTDDEDRADDHDHIQQELMKSVFNKYPEETMQFLSGIDQRGDEEISNLLNKITKGDVGFKKPQHPSSGDMVVPSSADRGHSDSGGEE